MLYAHSMNVIRFQIIYYWNRRTSEVQTEPLILVLLKLRNNKDPELHETESPSED
jgi:hypothetical protein